MGLDCRAIATNGYWITPASDLVKHVLTNGYLGLFTPGVSLGGITDSFNSDWTDSTGDIIYDSLGVSDPNNPSGINAIITNGYWNSVGAQLNIRVASWGFLGSFGAVQVWLTDVTAKSWVALNSKFRMR